MTTKEGKNLLRRCLAKIDSSLNIDTLLRYKCGTRKHAEDYQRDDIISNLTQADTDILKTGVPFLVTCYIHMEIYVAWHNSVGFGNGKYVVYKRDLMAFESDTECDYKEIIIGKATDTTVYIFRNESGINKFFQKALSH